MEFSYTVIFMDKNIFPSTIYGIYINICDKIKGNTPNINTDFLVNKYCQILTYPVVFTFKQ